MAFVDSRAARTFGGLWTALVTPFFENALDFESLDVLIEEQLEAKVTGVVVAGTTGEAPTLSESEYSALLEYVVGRVAGRAEVFAGAGSYDTAHSLELMRTAEAAQVDGFLIVTPYYNKPTQAGLYKHFEVLAQSTRLPIMLYSNPSRCGIQIELDTLCALYAKFPHCSMLKEAHSDCVRFSRLYRSLGSEFGLFAGDDLMSLPFIALGAKGLVSVASNRFAKTIKFLVDAALKGDIQAARAQYHELAPFFETLFLETNPGPIKGLLAHSGLIRQPGLRLPLVEPHVDTLARAVTAAQPWSGGASPYFKS